MLKLFESIEEILITLKAEENELDFLILEVEDFVDVVGDAFEGFVFIFSRHELIVIHDGLFRLNLLLLVLSEIDFDFFLRFFHHFLVFVLEFSLETDHFIEELHDVVFDLNK